MNEAFWIGIGACVGLLGETVGFIVHAVRLAYRQGVTDQRIKSLEDELSRTPDLREAFAELKGVISGLTASVDRLDRYLEHGVPRRHPPTAA